MPQRTQSQYYLPSYFPDTTLGLNTLIERERHKVAGTGLSVRASVSGVDHA